MGCKEAPALEDTGVVKRCPHCEEPLIEIDHYGELLIGCIVCNWWVAEDELPVRLDETDITALRGRVS
jgi:hypothetical protein